MTQEEPGKNSEILNGIRYVRPGNNFTPNFPLMEKVAVNGITEHPLFTFLKPSIGDVFGSRCPSPVSGFQPKEMLFYAPQDSSDIRWNFEKFLIGRNGTPLRQYESDFLPLSMALDIAEVIAREYVPPMPQQSQH
ncbi:glutathione peroxidase-like [Dermacentor andersoni]|uniref:glutathione peroxidase-like n=1 Tax=Dermacentor andersoni TaxID=34620 RepID=UPI003B3A89D4